MRIVVPNGASYVTQAEFNTAMALVACAQNNLEVSLEDLYENRNCKFTPISWLYKLMLLLDLPELSISGDHKEEAVKSPLKLHNDENIPEPNIKSNHQHSTLKSAYPGMKSPRESTSTKTTSTYDHRHQQQHTNSKDSSNKGLDTRQWFQHLEEITVTVAPEREGFIFKHVNYIVTNEKRSSIVLRRYSDFWWLLEVLLRRYPFRSLPNLPPKKLGGSKSLK
jgi:hypothetical protein